MLRIAEIPQGIEQDDRFAVWVRMLPNGEWTPLPTYAAWIDMHDVRQSAVGIFDFNGQAEVRIRPHTAWIHDAVVRPLSLGIQPACNGHELRFILHQPCDLMLEVNGERFHCLHLLSGHVQQAPTANVLRLEGKTHGCRTAEARRILPALSIMSKGRTLVFGAGFHVIDEYLFPIPSNTNVYLEPGAVILGGFIVQNAENVTISGHGIITQRGIHRYSSINGIRVSHSRNVRIDGLTFLNPAHYTVHLGGSENIIVCGIRSFSCEGWSDGIDMMSCSNVHIDRCFLRTSDDCIAIYGSRWEYTGNTSNVLVENCTLWADVAHPTNIGTHGDSAHGGDTIERITFRNINILEHHEDQPDYLGCLAINAGDKNIVRDILYEDIRVEHIEYGKLLDVQVKCNPDYNPAPGRRIEHVTFRNIQCDCLQPVSSTIAGYGEMNRVSDVTLENVNVCGKTAEVQVGAYADEIKQL